MEIKNISDIQKYTVAIFREKNFAGAAIKFVYWHGRRENDC